MHLSSARAPESQVAVEWPLTGGCWNLPKKDTPSKKFSHCCEGSEPHIMPPSLGNWQRDWESPGNLTLQSSGIWLQDFHRTGENRPQTWKAQKKTLPRRRGKEQWLHRKLNQNYLLVLEGLLWRRGSAGAHCRDGGDWQQLSGKVPFVNLTIELGHLRPKKIADG